MKVMSRALTGGRLTFFVLRPKTAPKMRRARSLRQASVAVTRSNQHSLFVFWHIKLTGVANVPSRNVIVALGRTSFANVASIAVRKSLDTRRRSVQIRASSEYVKKQIPSFWMMWLHISGGTQGIQDSDAAVSIVVVIVYLVESMAIGKWALRTKITIVNTCIRILIEE